MTRSDILWRIAQMASWPFQERFVIHGTADEYVLDTEIVENVDAIRYALDRGDSGLSLTSDERKALDHLLAAVRAYGSDALTNEQGKDGALKMKDGSAWRKLRATASDALAAFGVSRDPTLAEIENLPGSTRSRPKCDGGTPEPRPLK
jgi:hypothetical protein